MSTEKVSVQPIQGYGFNTVQAWCKFTPVDGANPTIVSNFGFASIVRTSEGLWTLTLQDVKRFVDIEASVSAVFSGTDYHELSVRSAVASTGVITIQHKWCTYATIVSAGPVVDDISGLTSVIVCVTGVAG